MGESTRFIPEKLVIGVLSTRSNRHGELISAIEKDFGVTEKIYGPYPFTFTTYYTEEMGSDIERYFYVMKELVSPDALSDIKLETNRIEQTFMEDGKRKINLDPGILSADRFILATTKGRGHRIPLQKGIYGEITLMYMCKEFQILPWTYTDFATDTYRCLLKEIRKAYLSQLRQHS